MKVRINDVHGPFDGVLSRHLDGARTILIMDSSVYNAVDPGYEGLIVDDASPEEWEALRQAGYRAKSDADPRDERLEAWRDLIDQSYWTVSRIKSLAWASRQLLLFNPDDSINDLELKARVSDLLEVLQDTAEDLSDNLGNRMPS